MMGRDRISLLPTDILDLILGLLPIEDAAKTAVLSTFWRDLWSNLSQLCFGSPFFRYIDKKYRKAGSYNRKSVSLFVINKVLLQHNGPIRKFVLNFSNAGKSIVKSRSFDFDQWLLLVSRKGVEEIHLSVHNSYKLPSCIFSCLTLKRLHLNGVSLEPINSPCILPNVTSLFLEFVEFCPSNLLDFVADVPKLENLSFTNCNNVFRFNITAPELCSLSFKYCCYKLPVNLDLRSISTLDMEGSSIQGFVEGFNRKGLRLQPPALNVEDLKLTCFLYSNDVTTSALLHLLRACPKLCTLDITLRFGPVVTNSIDAMLKLLEELNCVAQTHRMLRTLKLKSFNGLRSEMLFIKGLLTCFPTLEDVHIIRSKEFNYSNESEIMQEFLYLSHAATKAKIVVI